MYPLNSLHCRHALLSKFVAAAEEEDVEMREEGCKGKFNKYVLYCLHTCEIVTITYAWKPASTCINNSDFCGRLHSSTYENRNCFGCQ